MVKFEQVKLSSLKLPKRTVDRPTVDKLKTSIKKLGLINGITINEKRVVIDGLHRAIALHELKIQTVHVMIVN